MPHKKGHQPSTRAKGQTKEFWSKRSISPNQEAAKAGLTSISEIRGKNPQEYYPDKLDWDIRNRDETAKYAKTEEAWENYRGIGRAKADNTRTRRR